MAAAKRARTDSELSKSEGVMAKILQRKSHLEKLRAFDIIPEDTYRKKMDKLLKEAENMEEGGDEDNISESNNKITIDLASDAGSTAGSQVASQEVTSTLSKTDTADSTSADDAIDVDEEDKVQVVDLSTSAKFGKKVGVRLGGNWNVYVDVINFSKGGAEGSFEVITIERAAKDEKSKPYRFNAPIRYLPKIVEALSNINRVLSSVKELTVDDVLKMVRDENGYVTIPSQLAGMTRTVYVVDLFTIEVCINFSTMKKYFIKMIFSSL